jgi:hypothetical protein
LRNEQALKCKFEGTPNFLFQEWGEEGWEEHGYEIKIKIKGNGSSLFVGDGAPSCT